LFPTGHTEKISHAQNVTTVMNKSDKAFDQKILEKMELGDVMAIYQPNKVRIMNRADFCMSNQNMNSMGEECNFSRSLVLGRSRDLDHFYVGYS
jgi:hypothetical protein